MDFYNKLKFLFNTLIVLGMIFMAIGFGYLAVEDKLGFIFFFGGMLAIAINIFSKEVLWRLKND